MHPRGSKGGGRLFKDGIYTPLTPHNNLTSEDMFANLSKLFVVPSTDYILNKVVQAYMALLHKNIHLTLTLKSLCMIKFKGGGEVLINNRHRPFPTTYRSFAIIDLFFVISF